MAQQRSLHGGVQVKPSLWKWLGFACVLVLLRVVFIFGPALLDSSDVELQLLKAVDNGDSRAVQLLVDNKHADVNASRKGRKPFKCGRPQREC